MGYSDENYDNYSPSAHHRESSEIAGGDGHLRNRRPHGNYEERMTFSRSNSMAPQNNRFEPDGSRILKEESRKCAAEMHEELEILKRSRSPDIKHLDHSRRLLSEEISKLGDNLNPDWLEVSNTPSYIKIVKFVLLPKRRPGLNVVGRLIGNDGKTLQQICKTYKCRISVAGAGSTKNTDEELRLLYSGDPRYAHFNCPLHAEISTSGSTPLAYARLSQLLALFHKLVTVKEPFEQDGISFEARSRERNEGQQQFSEMPKVGKPNYAEGSINPSYADHPAFEDVNQPYESERRF